MWAKLQALRDYHTASEEQGIISSYISLPAYFSFFALVSYQESHMTHRCGGHHTLPLFTVLHLRGNLTTCVSPSAEANDIYQDLEAPILATCEVADIVEAVQIMQVCSLVQVMSRHAYKLRDLTRSKAFY